jgi:hypothetical protein
MFDEFSRYIRVVFMRVELHRIQRQVEGYGSIFFHHLLRGKAELVELLVVRMTGLD